MMLTDRGVAVLDVPPGSSSDIGLRAHELRRAVADHIGLGGWCDRLAWCAVVDPWPSWVALYGARGQRRPSRAPLVLFGGDV